MYPNEIKVIIVIASIFLFIGMIGFLRGLHNINKNLINDNEEVDKK